MQVEGHPYREMINVMDFITIASTGNASDFGDLSSKQLEEYLGGLFKWPWWTFVRFYSIKPTT